MLTRYGSLRPSMRGAVTVLAVSVFVAVAAAGVAQAQTIYYNFSNATPAVGSVCTTTTYVDGYGNPGSYVTCRPSYTIQYYTPGYEKYYFYVP